MGVSYAQRGRRGARGGAAHLYVAIVLLVVGCARSVEPTPIDRSRYDFDGDGFDDLLVGDPSWSAGRGALWLVRGSAEGPRAPELVLEGEPLERLGAHLFHVGDRDGDGLSEVGVLPDQRLGWEAFRRARYFGVRGVIEPLALFGIPETEPGGPAYWGGLAVAGLDADGDPRPDLHIHYGCGERCRRRVLLSQTAETSLGTDGPFAYVSDADGDARPDLISSSDDRPGLVTLGLFELGVRAELDLGDPEGGVRVTGLGAAGDLDGDGAEDVLTQVFRSDDGTYAARIVRFSPLPQSAEAPVDAMATRGDFDCDGFDDLWMPGEILHGDATLSFARRSPTARSLAEHRPRLVDLDGDGCGDEVGQAAAELALFPGRSDGTVGAAWSAALPTSRGRAARVLFVGEGAQLVVEREQDAAGVSVILVVDGESFAEGRSFWYEGVADLDADGEPDHLDYGGTWGPVVSTLEPRRLGDRAALAGDVDGDGRTDAVVREGARTVILRGGPGFPAFVLAELTIPLDQPELEAAGDLDGDGHGDFVRRMFTETEVWLGAALLEGATEASARYPVRFEIRGDVDFDGLADLVAFGSLSAEGGRPVTLHRGRAGALPATEGEVYAIDPGHELLRGGVIAPTDTAGPSLALYRLAAGGMAPLGDPIATPPLAAGPRHGFAPPRVSVVSTSRGSDGATTTLIYLREGHADGGLLVPVTASGPGTPRLVRLPDGTADRLAISTWLR